MIRKAWRWLVSAWHFRRLGRLERMVLEAEGRMAELIRRASASKRRLASAERRFREIAEAAMEDFDDLERVQRQYETTVAGLRAELKVERDCTIPTLVRQHKLLMGRYDAEIAVQKRIQVGAQPNKGEDLE